MKGLPKGQREVRGFQHAEPLPASHWPLCVALFFFFLPPATPAVSYSVAIDTTTANHISTTRFVSDCTMGPLFCGITLREESIAGNHGISNWRTSWVTGLRTIWGFPRLDREVRERVYNPDLCCIFCFRSAFPVI